MLVEPKVLDENMNFLSQCSIEFSTFSGHIFMKEVERFCDFRWENENMNKVEVLFSVLFLLTKMKVERFFFLFAAFNNT